MQKAIVIESLPGNRETERHEKTKLYMKLCMHIYVYAYG